MTGFSAAWQHQRSCACCIFNAARTRSEKSKVQVGLIAAIRYICTSKKLDRRSERLLSSSCPIWFAPAAKVRFGKPKSADIQLI
jgi:hypothetical protein